MTPRENLLGLYRRTGYRHAPVHLNWCPALEEHYRRLAGDAPPAEYFGYPEGFATRGIPGLKLKPRPAVDWAGYFEAPIKPGTRFDAYGVASEPGSAEARHMTRMRHPLARATSLEDLQAYPFPEFDTDDTAHMREAVAQIHAGGLAAVGGMQCTIWERAWYVRDMTELMMDMLAEDEKAVFLLDLITEQSCARAAAFAAAGADIIEFGDDVGMQHALLMSRELWGAWLKPRLARVIAAARAAKPDVLVFYHSCGYIEPLIEDLIGIGVDILNPVQPECMDFGRLRSQYGDRLSFNGTLGTQTTMPFGTPAEVRRVVWQNLELAGARGGLFCCPTHLLEPEVPWENIRAYVDACRSFTTAGG